MPTYEYKCDKCDGLVERHLSEPQERIDSYCDKTQQMGTLVRQWKPFGIGFMNGATSPTRGPG